MMKNNGWCILDKPKNISSNQALGQVKKIFGCKKAGYIGTLDPLAHGVLVIGLGEATKAIHYVDQSKKIYNFKVEFGYCTDSFDLEGEIISKNGHIPKQEEIENILPEFIGEILQVPPVYSAIKIGGKRAYKLARENVDVVMPVRNVSIYSLKLLCFQGKIAEFEVECGSGTYVRSLAVDIAKKLGALATVIDICRLASGKFLYEHAIKLDNLKNFMHNVCFGHILKPIAFALDDIPAFDVSVNDVQKILQGKKIQLSCELISSEVFLLKYNNEVLALGKLECGVFSPKRVFNI